MRVTPTMVNLQLQTALETAFATMTRDQNQISSGKRILTPSDDPGGTAEALAIRARQAATAGFQKAVNEARGSLGTADDALRTVVDTLGRAKELVLQAANGTNDAGSRQAIGNEVNQLLEQLVTLANSRGSRGEYIFGGQETTTAPYTVTRDAAGQISAVTVNARGIDDATTANVSDTLSIGTGVSGTTVFGPMTDATNAFDVLIDLRNALQGQQKLTLNADVSASGAANASAYLGIDAAADLSLLGPSGTAAIGLTVAGDDAVSYSGNATSAIATAAEINLQAPATGVTATATAARITYSAGTFASDLTLDGVTAGARLVINGTSITGAVSGSDAGARRDALVALINGSGGATGVTATAVAGSADDFALTAADGRNISLETDATVTAGSANALFFGYSTGLTATGAATTVVARGGVQLSASTPITTTVAAGAAFADQVGGESTTGIDAAVDAVDTVLDRATLPSTITGSRLAWLDQIGSALSQQSVTQSVNLGAIEDVDYAKVVSELQQIQVYYQAALASGAQMLHLSLVNFLK